MPELSRFYGIVIRMYAEHGESHHLPHFHAYYQGQQAVVSLQPLRLLEGQLSTAQWRMVESWANLHQAELIESWQLLQRGERPARIEPLP